MTSALLVTGCGSTKKTSVTSVTDSLQWNRKVSVTLEAIQPRSLEWTLTPPDLHNLVNGERLSVRGNGLGLSARMSDGNLQIEAETDSLPRMRYTEEISATKVSEAIDRSLTGKEAATGPFKRCLNGIIIALTLVLIILIILKWQKIKQDRSA